MGDVPEESPEQKRERRAQARRARRDRMIANQEFTADRTAMLRRQFGGAASNFGGAPGRPGIFGRLSAFSTGARAGQFSTGFFSTPFG